MRLPCAADLALADRQRLHLRASSRRCRRRAGSAPRPGVQLEPGVEHVAALVGVGGRHHRQVRHRAQVGVVEGAVVGRAVAADQAAAVEREQHRQVLDRDVVDQLVVAALQEGRVDRHHRAHALAGEARGEGHRVLLGDAGIEIAIRSCGCDDRRGKREANGRRSPEYQPCEVCIAGRHATPCRRLSLGREKRLSDRICCEGCAEGWREDGSGGHRSKNEPGSRLQNRG